MAYSMSSYQEGYTDGYNDATRQYIKQNSGIEISLNEFIECIAHNREDEYIVKLRYKHELSDQWTETVEVCSWDQIHGIIWFNDWWEGESYVKVVAYCSTKNGLEAYNNENTDTAKL